MSTIGRLNDYKRSLASVIRITKWILTGKLEIVLNVFAKKGKHEKASVRLRRSTESTGPETTEILPGMISAPSFYNLRWLDRGVSLHWIGSKERSLVERLCDDPQGNDSRCQGDSQAASTLWQKGGVLLARPLSELYDHVRDFFVYVDQSDNRVVGCCALQFCWEDLAEIRSLAVQPEFEGRGIGRALAKTVISEAESFKTRKIFTLTYEPGFFKNFGFKEIDRAELPLKIWADCIICVKFPDCDETAMMKDLGENG